MIIEDKKLQERINYIVEEVEGERVYTGQSVNYHCVCSSRESIDDLKEKISAAINMWLDFGKETMAGKVPLEMHELTLEQWEAKNDNIDFWEIERMKRIMKRPTIREKFKSIIEARVKQLFHADCNDLAEGIVQALIDQPNE